MVKFEVESESCVRTSGRLKYQRENGVGQDWSFLRGKSKKDQELFQAKDESKPSIKKEAERTDDKEAVKRRANSDPKQESPSTKARMKKEENGPSSLCVALKQEIKEEIKPGSGLEEEMRVDRRPPAHSHAEPASPSQRYTRRKSSNNTVASDLSSPRGIKVKREISPDALPPPDIDHTAQAGTKVQAVAFQHEPRAAQHLTLEEKQATEKLWRSKIVKKVKPENLRFDLNVLWSRLVTAKIPPDLFPVTLEPAIRDVCVSRVFMSKTWGGSSQRTFPPIDKKKFKHGLDDFMYPGSASQSATPEVPGAPGLWLDVEDTSGTWWRDRYGDTPVRLFTCIVKSPARWQYQGQYRIRIAKTLEKEEWRQQKAEVRNAWAKKMSKGKHYYGLREYLVAKRFLGREPEEDEIEQLHAGTMSTDMSEAEIQLCMTKGDLRMGVYTMECVGYDEDFQRQVAEKWATWVPPPTTKKRKAPKQLAAANKKKRKTGDDKKSKGKIERDAEEEEEEETYDVGSESEDGEDGDDENDVLVPQAHGVTTNQGDFNLAGRDVIIQKHYHSYPDRVDISAVLGAIRNLRAIHLDILSKATPGTGVWLLKTDKFILWLDPNGNLKILWGTGIPGAGKTVLVSIVIRELEALAAVKGSRICVCYVYIRYGDRADLSVRNILETFVKQTVERHPECALIAENAYTRHLREKTQPTEAELLELLWQFTEVNAATFYLLDALDEAPDRIQVDLVLKLASLNVRLFVTSRPLDAVQDRVPNAHFFPIAAKEGDLDLHINQEISRSRDLTNFLKKSDPSLRDEIVSLVKRKCGGMFLHASLQLDALCECVTAHEVLEVLEAFPCRIEDVYHQTWQRILEQKSSHVLLAKATLVWARSSSRSMTIEELERAVATSPKTYKFEPNRLAPGTTLMALCHGLVTLEEESRLVRLVHYTAKDTLQGLLHDSFPHPHSHLAMVCMTHLAQCGFQNTTINSEDAFIAARQADPLLAYASDAWAVHARLSLDIDDTRRRTASFIRESHAFPAFTEPDLLHDFDILSPLHVLAMYHLPLSLLMESDIGDSNVATHIYQESPLTLASWHGHKGAVASLLAHSDILVNLVNRDGWSAVMAAARHGHEGIVRLLLAHSDIRVNLVDKTGLSALMMAASEGHERVIILLLKHPGIRANVVNSEGWSALMLAANNGHKGTVQLLLAHPEIQVNSVEHGGWSALMLAANNGHEDVVKLLVRCSFIHVNLVSNKGWSALMLAAANGHDSIVQALLEHPEVLVNLVENKGWSALTLAARDGHEGVVKLLIGRPEIQVNLVNNKERTALMLAANNGYEGAVRLLLAHPELQVNLVEYKEWSALMLAAGKGHKAVVELLVGHPAMQVNLIDKEGVSALLLAAGHGHLGVVASLLESPEVLVNLADNKGWSALKLAALNGHEAVVQLLLLRAEIQVNLVDHEGLSALMSAAEWGHESVVRLLLDVPHIDTTTKGTHGQTAMSIALANGHVGIAQLLRDFQSRCKAQGRVTVVDLDLLQQEEALVEEEAQDNSGSEDSDCYEDAEEWLEGIDVRVGPL